MGEVSLCVSTRPSSVCGISDTKYSLLSCASTSPPQSGQTVQCFIRSGAVDPLHLMLGPVQRRKSHIPVTSHLLLVTFCHSYYNHIPTATFLKKKSFCLFFFLNVTLFFSHSCVREHQSTSDSVKLYSASYRNLQVVYVADSSRYRWFSQRTPGCAVLWSLPIYDPLFLKLTFLSDWVLCVSLSFLSNFTQLALSGILIWFCIRCG